MIFDKTLAITALRPNASWSMVDDQVFWNDLKQTEPTKSEIDTKLASMISDWDAQEYARNRAIEYPSIPDQLDEIFHNGIDSWKAIIKVTKDKFPKG